MKGIVPYLLILTLPFQAFSKQSTSEEAPVGQACRDGTNTAVIVWAVFGAAFLVTIGIIAAVVIAKDNNDKVVIVQY
ncbi:MAG: hypothetical protein PVI40_00580 [Chlamydiota bacterium]